MDYGHQRYLERDEIMDALTYEIESALPTVVGLLWFSAPTNRLNSTTSS